MKRDKIKSLYFSTKSRCRTFYKNINFCWETFEDFKNWLLDNGYIPGKSELRRIDKNKDFSPNNCNVSTNYKYEDNINNTKEVIKLFNKTKSAKLVSKKLKIPRWSVYKILKNNKVDIRKGEFQRKYEYNENYFEKIDTEEKAYWLGFLYADGCVREWYFRLKLSTKDMKHMEKFKNELNAKDSKIKISSHNYYYEKEKRFIKGNCCEFFICAKKFATDLIDKGCFINKTFKIKFPTIQQVPENLQRHFIRGFFDGDGNIHKVKKQNRYDCSFTCGSFDFIKSIENILSNICNRDTINISKRKNSNAFWLCYSKADDIKNIYHYFYDNSFVFLERKKDIFKGILDWNDTTKIFWDKYKIQYLKEHYKIDYYKDIAKKFNTTVCAIQSAVNKFIVNNYQPKRFNQSS